MNELQVINIEDYAMSAETIQRQVNIIQEIMHQVMKNGEHYGVIPGCGNKPTLFKPGAEKLGVTFRFSPSYKIEKTDLGGGHREYEVVCTMTHIPSGLVVGQGVGSCSTMEGKYRFRQAAAKCPECSKSETIIKGKKEYGGGWVCFKKKGGCGAKFNDGDERIENQDMGRIEHDNPADYYNTVLKMSKKRAQVDAILTCTAASDIYTQDIEDMPEVIPGADKKGNETPKKQENKKQDKTPWMQMCDALKEKNITNQGITDIANFIKVGEDGILSEETMLDVAKRPDTYINVWKEASDIPL